MENSYRMVFVQTLKDVRLKKNKGDILMSH